MVGWDVNREEALVGSSGMVLRVDRWRNTCYERLHEPAERGKARIDAWLFKWSQG